VRRHKRLGAIERESAHSITEVKGAAVTDRGREHLREGLLYGFAAYGVWGLMPLYFAALEPAGPIEILCHRIVWSLALLAVLLTLSRRWPELLRCVCTPRTLGLLVVSTVLIAVNWFAFIYGVATKRVADTSLGYFITPLVNVLLGLVFLGERLRLWQWVAMALATAGLAVRVVALDELPWIALTLAGAFGLYGFVRKQTPVESLVGLSVETAALFPAALAVLLWMGIDGRAHFGGETRLSLMLAGSGAATAIPLLFFGAAARRLPLTVLGVLQYFAPSVSLLLAVFWFHEGFPVESAVSFGLIWAALALFTTESLLVRRSRPTVGRPTEDAAGTSTPPTADIITDSASLAASRSS
jgi:chloramphenicol-sensitive protein RarD